MMTLFSADIFSIQRPAESLLVQPYHVRFCLVQPRMVTAAAAVRFVGFTDAGWPQPRVARRGCEDRTITSQDV